MRVDLLERAKDMGLSSGHLFEALLWMLEREGEGHGPPDLSNLLCPGRFSVKGSYLLLKSRLGRTFWFYPFETRPPYVGTGIPPREKEQVLVFLDEVLEEGLCGDDVFDMVLRRLGKAYLSDFVVREKYNLREDDFTEVLFSTKLGGWFYIRIDFFNQLIRSVDADVNGKTFFRQSATSGEQDA